MFKISSNLMSKVLKMIQLHDMIFPQTLLHYFMDLQFQFDIYDKKSLSDTYLLKIVN
jgi:hypothetical protein